MIQSIINFERKVVTNLHKFKNISIIDGENFKFLPYTTKFEFLDYYSRYSTLFFVSKSNNHNFYLKNTNNIYYFKVSPINNFDKTKKYCSDDSFCIYMANLLYNNKKDFVLFSNDKYRDYKIIKNQQVSLLDFIHNKYNFNPEPSLKNINVNDILIYKQNFF